MVLDEHIFAFYWPKLSKILKANVGPNFQFNLDDESIVHRVNHVVRLSPGNSCILFDSHEHLVCTLVSCQVRQLSLIIQKRSCNKIVAPRITFLLPLLKREAFEQAIYSMVELGANAVQLVITQKMQRQWAGDKEFERISRIVHAAAEQSKNFAFPVIYPPLLLAGAADKLDKDSTKIFFDPSGCKIMDLIVSIKTSINPNLVFFVGPEGDCSCQEKIYLNQQGFIFCQLVPTILRAEQAVTVALGTFRSCI